MVNIDRNVHILNGLVATLNSPRKEQIEALLQSWVGEKYLTAPAAARAHDSEPGGLLDHSLKVYVNLLKLVEDFGTTAAGVTYDQDSLTICALFHDLGKIGTPAEDYYIPVTEDWKKRQGYNYEINKKVVDGLSHAQRSVRILANQGVFLTDEEHAAILLHDGPLQEENYQLKWYKNRFWLLLHTADYLAYIEELEKK